MLVHRFSGNDEAMADVEPLRRSARTTSHKSPSADPDELYVVLISGVEIETNLYPESWCILPPALEP